MANKGGTYSIQAIAGGVGETYHHCRRREQKYKGTSIMILNTCRRGYLVKHTKFDKVPW